MQNLTTYELEGSDRVSMLPLLQTDHPQAPPPDVNASNKNRLHIHIMSSCPLISAILPVLEQQTNK